jgi:predicted kinase
VTVNKIAETKPTFLMVHGMPGTGKTTLARKLSTDLRLPLLEKDALKEFLFDRLGTGDLVWSQTLGRATFGMLYVFIDRMLSTGESFMIECPFYREFALPEIEAALEQNDARLIEVYCTTEPSIRKQRFIKRNENGERHPGHADIGYYKDVKPDSPEPTQYEPLALGELLTVDTTQFGDAEYVQLLRQLLSLLEKEKE